MGKDKFVYLFSEYKDALKAVKGDYDALKGLLGGKGSGLARMFHAKLPVPFGFTVTTVACVKFMESKKLPDGCWDQVLSAMKEVQKHNKKKFGEASGQSRPLLVSCRSGAKFSMPGMMDTVLNIGLNDELVEVMAKLTNDRFAWDAYRRLIQSFGSVVMGVKGERFEEPLKHLKKTKGYGSDVDVQTDDWKALAKEFKEIIQKDTGKPFPQDVWEQLRLSVSAVFQSWNGERAFAYRRKANISDLLGTACNIQTMVFGNTGPNSATGVSFTRNPSTGERKLYGEYLINAQGEDVVAGIRNCSQVAQMEKDFPTAFAKLNECCAILEAEFKNMQDMEWTIEEKEFFMLQTRDAKRTARAQVRTAIEMVEEKLIDKEEAVMRLSAMDINVLLLPQLDKAELEQAAKEGRMIAKGVNASPGGAVGRVYFDAATAERQNKAGEPVILVRPFTKPEDVPGFFASKGILTAEGGATSHAAVVARQFGVPCICGASTIHVDLKTKEMVVNPTDEKRIVVKEGDFISLDATNGEVYAGKIATRAARFEEEKELGTLLTWCDDISNQSYHRGPDGAAMRGLQVWANADYGADAARARAFGAQGLGLCRTEHMFFEKERLPIVQQMILAKNPEEQKKFLDQLLPFQISDFDNIFTAMNGLSVIIRLLDPPLHEFLPDYKTLIDEVAVLKAKVETGDADAAKQLEAKQDVLAAVERFHESNPMMGLRGIRLSIVFPQILEMQFRAIFRAALQCIKRDVKVHPHIMVPLITHVNELGKVKPICERVFSEEVPKEMKLPYKFGTMVETPRAAVTAGKIATIAEFFSFGTNDLTQMTFGISRDDAEREFLIKYVNDRILPSNPFQTLDGDGVGKLIQMACSAGRQTNPHLHVGICGEVGGEEDSINLVFGYGLDYVSCSPFRVPAARLGAAHAAVRFKRNPPAKKK